MADRIYVTYHPLGPFGSAHHAQLHYERSDPDGNVTRHATIDFGPKNPLPPGEASITARDDWGRTDNSPNAFGPIGGASNPDATPERPSGPYEPIASGDDLSANWGKMLDAMEDIKSRGYPYRMLSQNSNTAANAALQAGGLRPARGIVLNPRGLPSAVLVPALHDPLQNPLGLDADWTPQPSYADAFTNTTDQDVRESGGNPRDAVRDNQADAAKARALYWRRVAPNAPPRESRADDNGGRGLLGAVIGAPADADAAPSGGNDADAPFDQRLAALDRALAARGLALR
jgi:hypothetical protein